MKGIMYCIPKPWLPVSSNQLIPVNVEEEEQWGKWNQLCMYLHGPKKTQREIFDQLNCCV
jgi:hypothetical protein